MAHFKFRLPSTFICHFVDGRRDNSGSVSWTVALNSESDPGLRVCPFGRQTVYNWRERGLLVYDGRRINVSGTVALWKFLIKLR